MLAAPPAQMPDDHRAAPVPPPPPPPPPSRRARPAARVPRAGDRPGLVTVLGTHADADRAHPQRGMFASGSATVQPRFVPLLERIGEALKEEQGRSGDRLYRQPADPHRAVPVQLPALRGARRGGAGDHRCARSAIPARISAEGRADADPIAPNATPEGREQNRRIEIVLRQAGLTTDAVPFCASSVSRWFLSFVGIALLAVLVWLFGPLLSCLEDWSPRSP